MERKKRSPGDSEGRRKKGGDTEPNAEEEAYEQESLETVEVEASSQEMVETLKGWLRSEECGGLSVAQNGALVALAIHRSGTPLGKYLERLVEPGSDVGKRELRQRGVLPLPLLPDTVKELKGLFESGEFRRLAGSWAAKKQNKEKAGKEMRRIGLLLWHGLAVCLVNFLWCGGGRKGPVHQGTVTKAQQMALDRLWSTVRNFVDDTSETKEKIPRSPDMGEWGKKLGDVRISYQGEVVEKAQTLTLDQIMPGLPPPGYGASVPLVELCDGELREKLENPLGNILPEEEMPDDLPRPKVHASAEQWEMIVKELYARGLKIP